MNTPQSENAYLRLELTAQRQTHEEEIRRRDEELQRRDQAETEHRRGNWRNVRCKRRVDEGMRRGNRGREMPSRAGLVPEGVLVRLPGKETGTIGLSVFIGLCHSFAGFQALFSDR